MIEYRGYTIVHDPKPIPIRTKDWDYVHNEYDGPGDNRCGSTDSLESAKAAIDELYEDE
jgi:hypothetical protein